MKQSKLVLVGMALVAILLSSVIVFLRTQDDGSKLCLTETDGSTRCYDTVPDFIYALSGEQLMLESDITLGQALPTYSAFMMASNAFGIPGPAPDFLQESGTPAPLPFLSTPGSREVCPNMPDGSIRCFDSAADFVLELTEGQLALDPNVSLDEAIHAYNDFAMTHYPPRTVEPTLLPNGATADATALQLQLEQIIGTEPPTPVK